MTDWSSAGGSPFPTAVLCPISYDSSAARVALPKKADPGTAFVTDVGVRGAPTGTLPSTRGYELVDNDTVLVHLTGTGEVASGPQYEPPAYPGASMKALLPTAGTPYVVVVMVPPQQF